jgi:hypothetical protein
MSEENPNTKAKQAIEASTAMLQAMWERHPEGMSHKDALFTLAVATSTVLGQIEAELREEVLKEYMVIVASMSEQAGDLMKTTTIQGNN